MVKKGVLLINLGTPDALEARAVYRYLTQFLNDPRVIDLPVVFRWALVNLLIVPFRYKKSLHAYQKIWLDSGSPLLENTQRLQAALSLALGKAYHVAIGMRYGNPSIASGFRELKKCNDIVVVPLFPQYSSAATGSAIAETLKIMAKEWNIPGLSIKKEFYQHPGFINAYAALIQAHINNKNIDHIIFSYHGLPERHINKSLCEAACNRMSACPEITDNNAYCYRAQCYKTSQLLANALHFCEDKYTVSFQSRLGKTPWIKPYTDVVLSELREKNIESVAIVCPSFVADCLETLEEINLQIRARWQELGGKDFIFVPCLNDSPLWVKALSEIIECQ